MSVCSGQDTAASMNWQHHRPHCDQCDWYYSYSGPKPASVYATKAQETPHPWSEYAPPPTKQNAVLTKKQGNLVEYWTPDLFKPKASVLVLRWKWDKILADGHSHSLELPSVTCSIWRIQNQHKKTSPVTKQKVLMFTNPHKILNHKMILLYYVCHHIYFTSHSHFSMWNPGSIQLFSKNSVILFSFLNII